MKAEQVPAAFDLDVPPDEILQAERLRLNGDMEEALSIVSKYLNTHFEDVHAIVMAARIMADASRFGLAQALFKFATKLRPDSAIIWSDLGYCYQEGSDLKEGEACFLKALQRNPNDAMALNNLSQLYVNTGQPMKAINVADKAIRIDPTLRDAHYNRSLAMLQLGDWKEGWKCYDHMLGRNKDRKERTYGIIPRWTGVKGLTIAAYGEQGLGDEISFASCIPDLMKDNKVIIECDKRLQGLFSRSFGCPVYGTRNQKEIHWPNNHDIDASVAFGSLPGFFRLHDSDFPGTPYLVADPQRRLQWRALLDSLGTKKKVGISWSGGLKRTGADRRSLAIADLMPIFRQDATFISLQYRDHEGAEALREEAGIDIHHWPHGTQTQDYDDTAALVAELDLVISVTQSCVQLAGGLGVPCWVLTPKAPLWRYGLTGDSIPWYKSVKLYRQKAEWVHVVSDIAFDLKGWLKN